MVSKTIFKDFQRLREYTLTINMGFATLKSPEGMTTDIMDNILLDIFIGLGVPVSYSQPNAGLTMMG